MNDILNEVRKELSAPQVIPFRSATRNIWSSFGSFGAMAAVILATALIVGLVVIWRENSAVARDELAEYAESFIQLVNTPGARSDRAGRNRSLARVQPRNSLTTTTAARC